MRFSQKGQAFDVFKLLIAAVVAGAILLILLQVLGALPGFENKVPNTTAANTVKSQVNNIGTPTTVKDVTFSENDALTASAIAEKSGSLSREQICLVVSGKLPNKGKFSNETPAMIQYTGQSTQRTRLVVLCDRAEDIGTTVESFGYNDKYDLDVDSCGFEGAQTQTVCLVAVVSDT